VGRQDRSAAGSHAAAGALRERHKVQTEYELHSPNACR